MESGPRSIDPVGLIGNVPGQTAEIIVQAANGAPPDVASEPILFTVRAVAKPLALEPLAPETAPARDELVLTPNGNGSNGHRNGDRLPALA